MRSGVKSGDARSTRQRSTPEIPQSAAAPNRSELHRRLCTAALDRAEETVADVLYSAAQAGIQPREALTDLVAGVARELGEMWREDVVTFLDVTLGAGKLQRAIHELGLSSIRPSRSIGRVLVTTMPGEQHVLGAVVGSRLLSLEGCETSLDIRGSRGVDDGAAAGFDLVAIAVPSERSCQRLEEMVGRLRSGVRHRRCTIVLVGRGATSELAECAGADASVAGVDDVLGLLNRGRTYES